MPKSRHKLSINLNLLKPQSNPEKVYLKLLKWLLSTGRFIFIFVEGIVLLAFIARFKLDADIASKKEAIEQQIPYIQSLKPYEILIRQTQLKLSTIDSLKTSSPDFSGALQKITDQIPSGVKITGINLDKNVNQLNIKFSGQSQDNNNLTIFFLGLKQDQNFADVNFTSIGFEKGVITFTISASFKQDASGGKDS